MEERRTSKRVAFSTTVHFGPPPDRPHDHKSFVTDLSDKGICVKTKKVFTPGTKLHLFVDSYYKSYYAEGVVAWSKKPPLRFLWKNYCMGIKFTSVDHYLTALYEEETKTRPGRA